MTLLFPHDYSPVECLIAKDRWAAYDSPWPINCYTAAATPPTIGVREVARRIGAFVASHYTRLVNAHVVLDFAKRDDDIMACLDRSGYLSLSAMLALEAHGQYEMSEDVFMRPIAVNNPNRLPILSHVPAPELFAAATRVLENLGARGQVRHSFQSFAVALIMHLGCLRAEKSFIMTSLRYKLSFCMDIVICAVTGDVDRASNTTHTIGLMVQ